MLQRLGLGLLLGLLPLTLASGLPAIAQQPAACKDFVDCLHRAMTSSVPLDKAMLASQGIQFWNKSVPQRDLYNLLQMRAEALVQLYASPSDARLLQQAEADYQQMLSYRPGDFLPQTGLARIAELRGQYPEADRLYAEAVKSNHPVAWLESADSHLRRQNPALALSELDTAVKLFTDMQAQQREVYPQHLLRLYQMRARALTALQRADEATAALKAACAAGDADACFDVRRLERWSFF